MPSYTVPILVRVQTDNPQVALNEATRIAESANRDFRCRIARAYIPRSGDTIPDLTTRPNEEE